MSILGQISNLSPIGPTIPKLAAQGCQILELAKSRRNLAGIAQNDNSRQDFKFEPNGTNHSQVS